MNFFIFGNFRIFFIKWIFKGYKPPTWKYRHEIIKLSKNQLLASGFVKIVMNIVFIFKNSTFIFWRYDQDFFVTEHAGNAYRQIKKCYEMFEISV